MTRHTERTEEVVPTPLTVSRLEKAPAAVPVRRLPPHGHPDSIGGVGTDPNCTTPLLAEVYAAHRLRTWKRCTSEKAQLDYAHDVLHFTPQQRTEERDPASVLEAALQVILGNGWFDIGRIEEVIRQIPPVHRANRVLWSDFHLFHRLMAKLRGFLYADGTPDVETMNEAIAYLYDLSIRDETLVYLAGDLSMGGKRTLSDVFDWLRQRRGKIVVVWGNHDPGFAHHSGAHLAVKDWMGTGIFEAVTMVATIKIDGVKVLVHHMPYAHGDLSNHTPEERYLQWRLPDLGDPLVHGHIHRPDVRAHGHEYHVGIDAHPFAPASDTDLADFLRGIGRLPAH